ncbi:uncharacterized protein LOC125617220 isoform X2 [Marmota marmota marmota]|uniref:uncharacterized protein LOC125617220 isoform X2 n=1 Tax=Marmota marmota marmota TaxID=9994 RepID=UPI002092B9D1|nr:uncharacterized protein LOC125617220 isoform X2 [Marmota marmota marmota]
MCLQKNKQEFTCKNTGDSLGVLGVKQCKQGAARVLVWGYLVWVARARRMVGAPQRKLQASGRLVITQPRPSTPGSTDNCASSRLGIQRLGTKGNLARNRKVGRKSNNSRREPVLLPSSCECPSESIMTECCVQGVLLTLRSFSGREEQSKRTKPLGTTDGKSSVLTLMESSYREQSFRTWFLCLGLVRDGRKQVNACFKGWRGEEWGEKGKEKGREQELKDIF